MSFSQWVDIEESKDFRGVVELERWDVALHDTLAPVSLLLSSLHTFHDLAEDTRSHF